MKINKRILDKLIGLANISECAQKMACVIVDKRDNILSFSQNLKKTHPMQSEIARKVGLEKKIYLHSEIAAICKNKGNINAYRAYTIRMTNNGFGDARPCPICLFALEQFGIFEIVYSINYNKFVSSNIGDQHAL